MSGGISPGADPRITLILGGARSGKSRKAEGIVRGLAPRGVLPVYVATAEVLDDEMAARIGAHRADRGAGWTLVEEPLDLPGVLARHGAGAAPVLVDCLTLWLTNLLLRDADLDAAVAALLATLERMAAPVVLVSNEVGFGIVPDNRLARLFRDAAGRLNQQVAAVADQVILVVAGLDLRLK